MAAPKRYCSGSCAYNVNQLRQLVRDRPEDTLKDYARTLGITPEYAGCLIRKYKIPYAKKESFRRKKTKTKPAPVKIPASHQKQITLIAMEARMRGLTYGQLVASGYTLKGDGERYVP